MVLFGVSEKNHLSETYKQDMAHSHVQRHTWIPVRGRVPVPKMGTVAILRWASIPFCLQCEYFFMVQCGHGQIWRESIWIGICTSVPTSVSVHVNESLLMMKANSAKQQLVSQLKTCKCVINKATIK